MKNLDIQNLEQPILMGILNLTPDSFYDGGQYTNTRAILKRVGTMLKEGATIIDLGAYSSRPNAKHISLDEEQERLLPILKMVVKEYPKTILSIDTFRSEIAKNSILEGASIINDISGGMLDENMFQTIADLQVPYIVMHMQGTPQNMQQKPTYTDVILEIKQFFKEKVKKLNEIGVEKVILDVGFGFGKTLPQNYKLLRELESFKEFKKPLLVGLSRKSMLYKALQANPEKALNASSVAHTLALLNGAKILRVHDVKEAQEVITLLKYYNNENTD